MGNPRHSSEEGKAQDTTAQSGELPTHWQKVQGSGCHVTLPCCRLTQPFKGQRLSWHDGQHSPGGVTGLAQRGARHVTLAQLTTAAVPTWDSVTSIEAIRKQVITMLFCDILFVDLSLDKSVNVSLCVCK